MTESREERNVRQRRERNSLVKDSMQSLKQVDAETPQQLTPAVPAPVPVAETPKGLLPTIRKVIANLIGVKK